MRVAVDTNRLTDPFRGDADLALYLGSCEEVLVPFVVLAEIKAGFNGGTLQSPNESILTIFWGARLCVEFMQDGKRLNRMPGYSFQ